MPNSLPVINIINKINKFKLDVIFHTFFLEGINDSMRNVDALAGLAMLGDIEFRLLRYNRCPGSPYKESQKIEQIIDFLSKSDILFKYQQSPGSEVLAACGQFICRKERYNG
jgi:adenine C2-methylase RlmN of 23S rRNA A2503 and tRNA A37